VIILPLFSCAIKARHIVTSFKLFGIFYTKALLAILTQPHIGGDIDHYVVTVLGNGTATVQANDILAFAFRTFNFLI